jgi:hypothetical protein
MTGGLFYLAFGAFCCDFVGSPLRLKTQAVIGGSVVTAMVTPLW